jgi:hypothetical protein
MATSVIGRRTIAGGKIQGQSVKMWTVIGVKVYQKCSAGEFLLEGVMGVAAADEFFLDLEMALRISDFTSPLVRPLFVTPFLEAAERAGN